MSRPGGVHMPYLKIQTNRPLAADAATALIADASRTVAEALGKPERYVMVALEPDRTMLFAGDDAPLAFLELKSIGLTEDQAPVLSDALCAVVDRALGVPKDRVFIEFAAVPRRLWGWNGGTF